MTSKAEQKSARRRAKGTMQDQLQALSLPELVRQPVIAPVLHRDMIFLPDQHGTRVIEVFGSRNIHDFEPKPRFSELPVERQMSECAQEQAAQEAKELQENAAMMFGRKGSQFLPEPPMWQQRMKDQVRQAADQALRMLRDGSSSTPRSNPKLVIWNDDVKSV